MGWGRRMHYHPVPTYVGTPLLRTGGEQIFSTLLWRGGRGRRNEGHPVGAKAPPPLPAPKLRQAGLLRTGGEQIFTSLLCREVGGEALNPPVPTNRDFPPLYKGGSKGGSK